MIDVAAEAGADYVKFQTFSSDEVITKYAPQAQYQLTNTGKKESQLEMVRKYELSHEQHFLLMHHCKERAIKFFSTGFDLPSVNFLRELNMGLFKIPSGEITNLILLELIGSFNEPIILSTGMSTLDEINAAIQVLEMNGTLRKKITLLHCTSEYPAPFNEINLKVLASLREKFNIDVGYSDHSLGTTVPIAAAALGATVIEKLFTLDREMLGPDHKASLEPSELKSMIQSIRDVELILGSDLKVVTKSEEKNRLVARKSLVAKKLINKGDPFSVDNLTAKRPGIGISPMRLNEMLSIKAHKNFLPDELITLNDTVE
jgi:N,N'-diacetyllegionaminate synthase